MLLMLDLLLSSGIQLGHVSDQCLGMTTLGFGKVFIHHIATRDVA